MKGHIPAAGIQTKCYKASGDELSSLKIFDALYIICLWNVDYPRLSSSFCKILRQLSFFIYAR